MENWIEIEIHTTNEASEIIESILIDYQSTGVSVEDGRLLDDNLDDNYGTIIAVDKSSFPSQGVIIRGYINELNFNDNIFESLKNEISNLKEFLNLGDYYSIKTNIIKDSDWENSWKEYFDVLEIGENFVIVPTWREYNNPNNKFIINIDPGMAFGTGGHETTSLCIKNLEKYVRKNDSIIDVGTGSGILAIASSYLTSGKIKAVDLDKLAVDVARENFKLNNIESRISLECSSLLENESEKYDVIVANILAHIISLMLEDAYKLLKDDGFFITSGIIRDKKDELILEAQKFGFKVHEITQENEWYSIIFTK